MEITLRIALFLSRIVAWLVAPFFWLLRLRKSRKVAKVRNQLLLMSATALAEKIRRKQIKSEAVVGAYIERIREVNAVINAIVEERFNAALQEARAHDARIAAAGDAELEVMRATQPLLGVPLTIKETCAVQGMSFATGSLLRRDFRNVEDCGAVAKLRAAGAIILLVSNTPEYCLYWETNNKITGRTNNPYNSHYSAGGSSGGEGALLGAGASLIGIGSDIAGSIRLPGLLNGVFAHKGSPNVVPTDGHFPPVGSDSGKDNFVIGPLVRYAQDLPLVFKVLSDNNPKLRLDDHVDLSTLNVFYMLDVGTSIAHQSVDVAIKRAINKCVAHLRDQCGVHVSDFKFSLENAMEIAVALFLYSKDVPNLLCNPISGKQSDWLVLEFLKQPFGCSKYSFNGLVFSLMRTFRGFVLPFRRKRYICEVEDLKLQFKQKLQNNGVFIYPTFSTSSYQHNSFMFKLSGVQYQSIFNNLGLPCTNVPMGLGSNGLPVGVQVVAGVGQDRLCFAVARELERAFGGWVPPS